MPYEGRTHNAVTVLYDLKETAELMGISQRTMLQYIKDERIPAQKIRGKYFISERNIHAFYNGAKFPQRGLRTGKYARKGQRVEPPKYPEFDMENKQFENVKEKNYPIH